MDKFRLKLMLAAVILLLCQGHLHAQTPDLVAAEYFIDVDPGHGLGTAISVSSPDTSVTFSISTTGLSTGLHTLHVRFKDANNNWSMTEARPFYIYEAPAVQVASIEAVEYFLDDDPGHGQGSGFTVGVGDTVDITEQISAAGLATGLHTLHVRARSQDGRWSMTESRPFYIYEDPTVQVASIEAVEYFLDDDPGHGQGSGFTVSVGDTVDITEQISTASLGSGLHTLHVRARSQDGMWSVTESRPFYIYAEAGVQVASMEVVEYFIDDDPGHGLASGFTVDVGDTVDIMEQISAAGLGTGLHTLHVRGRNQDGIWSVTEARPFYIYSPLDVTAPSPLVRLEYFFNTDPGLGAGVEIPISQAESVNVGVGLPTAGLPLDSHTVTVRSQNAAGTWSQRETRSFSIAAGSNDTPVVKNTIPDQNIDLDAGDPPFARDLVSPDSVFTDSNGDVLVYQASSSDSSVVVPGISGSILTVTALSAGSDTITVEANDGNGGTAQTAFTLTVTGTIAYPVVTSINPTSGSESGGTHVTIRGSNFRSGVTVTFGDSTATGVVVVSPDTITAITPAHAVGTLDLIITNPSGLADTLFDGFEFVHSLYISDLSGINGLASDGMDFWVTGNLSASSTQKLYKVRASDRELVTSVNIPYSVGVEQLSGVAHYSGYIYVRIHPSGLIYQYDPSTGTVDATSYTTRTWSNDMAFLGSELWQTRDNSIGGEFEVYDQSGHEFLGEIVRRKSIASDSTYLYIGDYGNRRLWKTTGDGTVVSVDTVVSPSGSLPQFLTYHNGGLWTNSSGPSIVELTFDLVSVSLPDTSVFIDHTIVSVPVVIEEDVTGLGVISAQMNISYDSNVIETIDVTSEGTLTQGWTTAGTVATGIGTSVDTVRIAMATARGNALSGSGNLVLIKFALSDSAVISDSTALVFEEFFFNEGDPPAITQDGSVRIIERLLGDVTGNRQVTAFDAALVLEHTVGLFVISDTLIADVSGDGTISSFDASLILRFVVGIITEFPAETGGISKSILAERIISLGDVEALPDGRFAVAVLIDEMDGVLSGQLELSFDSTKLKVSEAMTSDLTSDYLFANNAQDGRLRLSFAGVESVEGSGRIAEIMFESIGSQIEAIGEIDPVLNLSGIALTSAQLNEGFFSVVILQSEEVSDVPDSYSLHQNFPNPFNPETVIHYDLPVQSHVELSVYNMIGQKVATLVNEQIDAGSHSVFWDGKDDSGESLASGLYLYRLKMDGSEEFVKIRKLVLVR